MTIAFVTGATGIYGSNIATQLLACGYSVRALVRDAASADALARCGVELIVGSLDDHKAVGALVEGADCGVHAAALLGGAIQDRQSVVHTNVAGTVGVLDAADSAGVQRVAVLSTYSFFEPGEPITETARIAATPADDPYNVSKLAAFREVLIRISDGRDIRIIVPGGAFGPSLFVERSLVPPSTNQRIVDAITGRAAPMLDFPIPFAFASDVGRLTEAALIHGRAGGRYLGFGWASEATSWPALCNLACELAGSPHRVESVGTGELDRPEIQNRFGPSLVALARQPIRRPTFEYDETAAVLGYRPTPLRLAVERTVLWLARHRLIPPVPRAEHMAATMHRGDVIT